MTDNEPASPRQLARLKELNIDHDESITRQDACELLRAEMADLGMVVSRQIDPDKISSAIVAESEGDSPGGKQWV